MTDRSTTSWETNLYIVQFTVHNSARDGFHDMSQEAHMIKIFTVRNSARDGFHAYNDHD